MFLHLFACFAYMYICTVIFYDIGSGVGRLTAQMFLDNASVVKSAGIGDAHTHTHADILMRMQYLLNILLTWCYVSLFYQTIIMR